jgi:phosphonate metabolism protein PhnN/1,5-bisphosphokinase (PRPP-forming)
MTGRLFVVVGPSGAGKDTLIDAARPARPDLIIARRVITRPDSAGGEDFEGVSQAEFDRRKADGAFALDWKAHGLCYGIPAETLARRDLGHDVLFNGSRAALDRAAAICADLTVIRVTAPSEVLMQRLLARGRETRDQIAERISRASYATPPQLHTIDVMNDCPLPEAVARFLAALQPVSA